MRPIIKFIYSFILLPIVIIIAGILSFFKKSYRRAFFERFKVISKLRKFVQSNGNQGKKILIHCASMGEFEHIKPLISKISEFSSNQIILTFFSPSGYENISNYNGVSLIIYVPIDFPGIWRKFYDILNPALLIISKHDAWPNQIWIANGKNIPVFLVNASLNEKSSRIKYPARILFNEVYQAFDQIYAISESDCNLFKEHYKNIHVKAFGDTKFDQVVSRKKKSENKSLIPDQWLSTETVLIMGSVWPEDLIHLKQPLIYLLKTHKNFKMIIAPHQPDEKHLNEIKTFLQNVPFSLFTDNTYPQDSRILIVNTIGILADLYRYADIAYIGGSFKQGIHNVMEPAIYGLPVIYGPVYTNSYDAIQLLQKNGALLTRNKEEAFQTLNKLIENPGYRKQLGNNALEYALSHTGVSEKLVAQWQKYFQSSQ